MRQVRNTAQALYDAQEALRVGDHLEAGDAVEDAWEAFRRFEGWVNSITATAVLKNRTQVEVEREVRHWLEGIANHNTADRLDINLSEAIERGVQKAFGG